MNKNWDFTIELIEVNNENIRKRCCCNCGNNIRVKDNNGIVTYNECAIDKHHIGYVECFEGWCHRWKRDRKWDE